MVEKTKRAGKRHRLSEEVTMGMQVAAVKEVVENLEAVAESLEVAIAGIDQANPAADTADLEEAAEILSRARGPLLSFVVSWESKQRQELAVASSKR